MMRMQFRFDREKVAAALAYFAARGVDDLTVMKCMKLLYFSDKAHLVKYGRPITGDRYVGMEHGPVASNAYDLIKCVFQYGDDDADARELFARYVQVSGSGNSARFTASETPNLDVLSDSDLEVLNDVFERFGSKSAAELRRLAHEQPDVKVADSDRARFGGGSADIPYERFFLGGDDRMRDAVFQAQEDRDFLASLG